MIYLLNLYQKLHDLLYISLLSLELQVFLMYAKIYPRLTDLIFLSLRSFVKRIGNSFSYISNTCLRDVGRENGNKQSETHSDIKRERERE